MAFLFLTPKLQAGGFGNCDPDSLQAVSKNGLVSVQIVGMHTQYLLDEDRDGTDDYILNFGPDWYTPDEGNAVRPLNGDSVSIAGGLNTTNPGPLPVIVVYEINGQFWRNPYDPFWNNISHHYRSNRQGGMGYAPGWVTNPLEDTTISGTALVDTTLVYNKYYLDIDNDAVPDFHLNFGPYWYEPATGAQRPQYGDAISVEGIYHTGNLLPNIMVLELNGTKWRDTVGLGPQLGGRWIQKNMTNRSRIHCLLDSACYISMPAGWHGGGMMHDSLFGQVLQLMHQNMIQYQNQNGFMGFEIGMFNGSRQNRMNQNMWRMNFQNSVNYHLHYSQQLLNRYRKDETTIQLKRWNHQNQNWEQVHGANFDLQNNIVSFSDPQVDGFYMLAASPLISVPEYGHVAERLKLEAFPNPSPGVVDLRYQLDQAAEVNIQVLDLAGKLYHSYRFDKGLSGWNTNTISISDLTPGVYLVQILSPDGILTQKVVRSEY